MAETGSTVDPEEISRFARAGEGWWDPQGSFRPLHRLNPIRLAYIRGEMLAHFRRQPDSLSPFAGLSLLDVGCGGGLVAEPMARLGFAVTGIDAGAEAIAAARAHAAASGLAIDYRVVTAEAIAEANEHFDAVLALEIVEHVADPAMFFAALGALVKPGGLFIGATINRTGRSFALAILGAEYLLRWLPPGTHDWRKFLRPSEFILGLRRSGLRPTRTTGLAYDPLRGAWSMTDDLAINYMISAMRPQRG